MDDIPLSSYPSGSYTSFAPPDDVYSDGTQGQYQYGEENGHRDVRNSAPRPLQKKKNASIASTVIEKHPNGPLETSKQVCRKDAAAVVESAPSSSPASVLKRKRPARIDIPSLPSLSFPPPSEGGLKEIEMETERYSFFCKKGRREVMEDPKQRIFHPLFDLLLFFWQAFFGVFDGRGGTGAAEFAAVNLGKNIIAEVMKRGSDGMEDSVKSGYVTTDAEFLKEDLFPSTFCTVSILGLELMDFYCRHCFFFFFFGGGGGGLKLMDSRNIFFQGGYVDCSHGVWRLQGSLAVSRGIGDSHLKKWVIAEPETKILRVKHDCEFLTAENFWGERHLLLYSAVWNCMPAIPISNGTAFVRTLEFFAAVLREKKKIQALGQRLKPFSLATQY
ncbi:probable protein phosphatase 2C 25 [Magnolia sinica]|uniref:probable protein phosphatase 2C 25 n=1 Tax=Magnolia sinica TaxID=86752 RepID=UPI0026592EF3|nr:probable protein phosphatase 2C 25 [Magnolia sinica]